MHWTYCEGTSQAEATSNSEKIKPIALAIIELHYAGMCPVVAARHEVECKKPL